MTPGEQRGVLARFHAHHGVMKSTASVAAAAVRRIRRLRTGTAHDAPIVLTGHSLGGGQSMALAVYLAYVAQLPVAGIVTFGGMRWASVKLARFLNTRAAWPGGMPEIWRVTKECVAAPPTRALQPPFNRLSTAFQLTPSNRRQRCASDSRPLTARVALSAGWA